MGIGRVYRRGRKWWVDFRPSSTHRVRRPAGDRRADAQALLIQLHTEWQRAQGQAPVEARTWQEAVDLWERTTQIDTKATSLQRLERVTRFIGESRELRTLRLSDGDALRSWLLKQTVRGRDDRTLSPATVNRHLHAGCAVLSRAVDEGWIDRSPWKGLKKAEEPEGRDRICSPAEYRRLRAAKPSRDMGLALLFGYELGLSRQEVFDLRWEDFDWETSTLTVYRTKTDLRRTVPVSRTVVRELETVREASGPVLRTSINTFSHRWGRLCERASVKGLTFHDLRHVVATRYRRAGVDIVTVKKIFGWRSWATAERYQTVDHDDLVAAMKQREEAEEGSD